MTDAALNFLSQVGYDPEFGARPVKRAIQRYLLNDLSKKLLAQEVDRSKAIIVDAGGDIDEDGVDSKISCTELTILKRLTKKELFLHGLAFMADHPKRKWNSNIKVDKAEAWNGYAAVRGADPIAKGTRNGDVLAFAKEDGTTGGIQQIVVAEIDGKTLQPGIWYGVELEKRMVN